MIIINIDKTNQSSSIAIEISGARMPGKTAAFPGDMSLVMEKLPRVLTSDVSVKSFLNTVVIFNTFSRCYFVGCVCMYARMCARGVNHSKKSRTLK